MQLRRKTDMAAADNNTNDIVTAMTYEPLFNQIDTISDPKGNTTAYTYDHESSADALRNILGLGRI